MGEWVGFQGYMFFFYFFGIFFCFVGVFFCIVGGLGREIKMFLAFVYMFFQLLVNGLYVSVLGVGSVVGMIIVVGIF